MQRRKLPKGAQLVQVTELFDLPAEEREHYRLWLGGDSPSHSSGFMGIESLLEQPMPFGRAHLSSCPSSMIVVVVDERVQR